MDPILSPAAQRALGDESGPARCSICQRRLASEVHFVEETGNVPPPRQSWALCGDCDEAVQAELEVSTVRSAVRLRVAVGMVAAERTPRGRRLTWGGTFTDEQWLRILMWGFILGFIVHTIVMIAIARLVFGS